MGIFPKTRSVRSFSSGQLVVTIRSLAFLASAASSVSWTPSLTFPVSRATLRAWAKSILGPRNHRFEFVRGRDRGRLRGERRGGPPGQRARDGPVDQVD